MKFFKKITSLFLACCMCMTLLSTAAFAVEMVDNSEKASTAYGVYVNGVWLTDGSYWKNGDVYEASGNEYNYNAYFSDGTLYLRNATITRTCLVDDWAETCIYANGDLNIVLDGSNTISNRSAAHGICTHIGSLSISGNGSLSINIPQGLAIIPEGNINISDATVSVQAGGIDCLGTMSFNNAFVTVSAASNADGYGGIACSIMDVNNSKLNVSGGIVGYDEEGELYVTGNSLVSCYGGIFAYTYTTGLSVVAGNNETYAKPVYNFDDKDAGMYNYVAIYSPAYSPNRFVDVNANNWFYDSVGYAYNNGLMSGTGAVRFSPNTTMNRAMAATVLYNLSQKSDQYALPVGAPAYFSDIIGNTWYTAAVNWAGATGLVSGTGNNRYSPNYDVTREQFAVMLYNYAQKLGKIEAHFADLSSFSDKNAISDWAQNGMQWAVVSGVMRGSNTNKLNPQNNLTRAEAATMLQNFINAMK